MTENMTENLLEETLQDSVNIQTNNFDTSEVTMNIQDLKEEVQKRQEANDTIRENLDSYVENNYGILNFSDLVQKYFPKTEELGICLARQVLTANLEHHGKHAFSDFLTQRGLESVPYGVAFSRDCHIPGKKNNPNHYKKSLVTVPFFNGKKGGMVNKTPIVPKEQRGHLCGRIYNSIEAHGSSLIEYHKKLRSLAFGENHADGAMDISSFFSSCLRQCIGNNGKIKPKHVFVSDCGMRERRVGIEFVDFSDDRLDIRPPADWYYPLYLMVMVDGSKALLSTVDHDPTVIEWFERSNRQIENICGFQPLIIQTPAEVNVSGYKSDLHEVPNWTQNNQKWKDDLSTPERDDLYSVVKHFEISILQKAMELSDNK